MESKCDLYKISQKKFLDFWVLKTLKS